MGILSRAEAALSPINSSVSGFHVNGEPVLIAIKPSWHIEMVR